MKSSQFIRSGIVAALAVAMSISCSTSFAANRASAEYGATAKEEYQEVDLFQAIEKGDVEVKFIAKNTKEANVILENKTEKPLAIKMPEAFAGVPVLAQFGGGGGQFGGGGGQQGGGGQFQGGGGGFGGGGGGQGGFGGGGGGQGGFFNVDAGKVGKMKVPFMCLEHGKKDPNPRIEYKIVKIESFTQNSAVIELCKMLGRGEISQNIAQAAAWHMMDGLSWEELAHKDKVRLSNGYTEKFFNAKEIQIAYQATAEAGRRAERLAKQRGSKADSLSSK